MNIRKIKQSICTILSMAMLCSSLGTGTFLNNKKMSTVRAEESINNPRISEDGTVTWDKVEFGSYYQDFNQYKKEPIKWRILSISEDGTEALILADKILDYKAYNTIDENTTWRTCSLRKWLNDTEQNESFINTAFTLNEQNAILNSHNTNIGNFKYKIDGGSSTYDKVFILSYDEIVNSNYGFDNDYSSQSNTRRSTLTDYALYENNRDNTSSSDGWWLRTPGNKSNYALESFASLDIFGVKVNKLSGVRPALRINLQLNDQFTDAGEVDSNGNITNNKNGFNNPQIDSDGKVVWDCLYFGSYNIGIEFKKQPIEWRVLSVTGNDVFLLADKVLDEIRYNDTDTKTWEKSFARSWLNSNDVNGFINSSFSSKDSSFIISTQNESDFENATNDKVFFLSYKEIINAKYGFEDEYCVHDNTRSTNSTDYATFHGALDRWCTRPLKSKGIIDLDGSSIHGKAGIRASYRVGVRPAMHVNSSLANLKKTGTISVKSSLHPQKEMSEKNKEFVSKFKSISAQYKYDCKEISIIYDEDDKKIDYYCYYCPSEFGFKVTFSYDLVNDKFTTITIVQDVIPENDIYTADYDLSKYTGKDSIEFKAYSLSWGSKMTSEINARLNKVFKLTVEAWIDLAAEMQKIDLTQYGFSSMPKSNKFNEQPTTEQPTTDNKNTTKVIGGVGKISGDGSVLTDLNGVKYFISNKLTISKLKSGLKVADKKTGGKYKISKITKKKGKINGGTVTYMAPYNNLCTKATIPDFVKIAGVKFKVTEINKNAFSSRINLKSITIGKNVTKIGASAFADCSKLKSINIKATALTKIGPKAFARIDSYAKFKVPKKQLKKYTKMIKKAKAPKTSKISK